MSAALKAEPTHESWKAEREARIAKCFLGHEAHLLRRTSIDGTLPIDALKWAKPGTNNYRIDFLCDGPRLIVTGDLYEAIYIAGAPVDGGGLAWWAGCDIGYFASKCAASPSGRGFEMWDANLARINIRARFDDEERDNGTGLSRMELFNSAGGWDALGNEAEWGEWLRSSGDEVWDEEWSEMFGVGTVVDWLCLAHLRGLQLAIKALGLTVAR